MKIAKLVGSNSHISYIARVLDEAEGNPAEAEHGFGSFVRMECGGEWAVGVICDSRLVNPEYSSFTPRLAQTPALGELKREMVTEQKTLLGILILGTMSDGSAKQEIPLRVIAAGQTVETMSDEETAEFHRGADGNLQMHYLPDLMAQAGTLAVPLARNVIARLSARCTEAERLRLEVMRDSLSWKHTFGDNRF